ncbi:MAG: hypothetical protein IKP66_07665, partial [Lachnospiraceae bacterium]|nr:hypothetical protein [Lachnospiraceae bacterium]
MIHVSTGTINISSCSIANNKNRKLIQKDSGELNIYDTVIDSNEVALHLIRSEAAGRKTTVKNVKIKNNVTTGSDGYTVYNLGTMDMEDIVLEGNTNNYHSFLLNSGTMKVDKIVSSNNTGGISLFKNYTTAGSRIEIKRATVSNNTLVHGVIDNSLSATIRMEDSYVCNNTLTNDLVHVEAGTVEIKNTSFVENTAQLDLIRNTGGTIKFEGGSVKNNTAIAYLIHGYNANNKFNIKDFTIKDNRTNRYLISLNANTTNFENTIIDNNATVNGVLYALGRSIITASASTISNNTQTYSGTDSADFINIRNTTLNIYGHTKVINNNTSNAVMCSLIYVAGSSATSKGACNIYNNAKLEIAYNKMRRDTAYAASRYSTTTIEEIAELYIHDNIINATNNNEAAAMIIQHDNAKVDANGSVTIENNYYTVSGTTVTEVASLRMINPANARLNIGSKKIKITNMIPMDSAAAAKPNYGVYSPNQSFMTQLAGTTFNEENYFEDVALGTTNGTGIVMANGNFVKSTEIAEKSFKASTYSNIDYRAYKGLNNNVVIGVRKINFDFNVPTGTTFATNSYPTYINVAGKTLSQIDYSTFRATGYSFVGWTFDRKEPFSTYVVDATDGGKLKTPFLTNELSQEFTVYALWGGHVHKVCGVASGSECTHDISHMSSHAGTREYEELTSSTTLVGGGAYYLTDNLNINRTINISGTVYICLNGYSLSNVAFIGANTSSRIYISNCNGNEASLIQNTSNELFTSINVNIYGIGNRIKFTTKNIIRRGESGFGDQYLEAYNAYFTPKSDWGTDTANSLTSTGEHSYNHKSTFSNVVFDGYTKPIIIANTSYTDGRPTVAIYNSQFINNTVSSNGVASNQNGTMIIENTTFDNNTLTTDASLIKQIENGTTTINNCEIKNTNKSGSTVGILINSTGTINISSTSIINNKAKTIINKESGYMSISGSVISDNTLNYAVIKNAIGGREFDITNTIIDNNSSIGPSSNEGYMFYNLGVMNLKDIIFNDNVSDRHTLFLNTNRFNIDGLRMSGNKALESLFKNSSETGAILNVKNATISNVVTTNDIIRNDTASTINIENAYFENCTSNSASMIYNLAGATISLKNVEMVDNKLNRYFIHHANGTTSLEKVRLTRNNGLSNYIFGQNGTINITDSKIEYNTVTNNLIITDRTTVKLINSEIVNNTTAYLIYAARSQVVASASNISNNNLAAGTTHVNPIYIYNSSDIEVYGNTTINNNTASGTGMGSLFFVHNESSGRSSGTIKAGATLTVSSNSWINRQIMSSGVRSTITIEENATLNLTNNILRGTSTSSAGIAVYMMYSTNATLIAYGNLNIKNNYYKHEHNHGLVPASLWGSNSCEFNIGSGKIDIENLIPYDEASKAVNTYGIYSNKQRFMHQTDGTVFNEENIFEDVALSSGTGIFMENDNFVKDTKVAEKSFTASTASNIYYKAYKGSNKNVVIGIRKVNFDFNVPAGKTLATNSYPSYKLIGGETVSKIDKATFRVEDYAFMGWTTERKDPYSTSKADVLDGGNFNTPFGTNELSQEWTLYALWGNHRHKICGTATSSECNHDNVHIGTHSTIMTYEELTTGTTIRSGGAYYLSGDLTLNRNINITGTVFICLNGFTLNGVSFTGSAANDTVYICNCNGEEANVTTNLTTATDIMFSQVNAYVYGSGNRINFNTEVINSRANYIYNFEVYNAYFKPVSGFIQSLTSQAIIGQNNNAHKTKISNSVFDGYTTTILLSNNANSSHAGAKFEVYNSKFINNTITGSGIIYNDVGTAIAENIIFDSNKINDGAYLIRQIAAGSMTISSASITNTNKASGKNGTLINNQSGTINISSASITNNKNAELIVAGSGKIEIYDTDIDDNAVSTQFMISRQNATIDMHNVNIRRNTTESYYLTNNRGTMNGYNVLVDSNISYLNSFMSGGGTGTKTYFENAKFINNKLTKADGNYSFLRYTESGELKFKNALIASNSVMPPGGALVNNNSCTYTFEDCDIKGNTTTGNMIYN